MIKMKLLLLPALCAAFTSAAAAATVLTNFSGSVNSLQLVAAADAGPSAEYGFEFRLPAGPDYQFGSLTLSFDFGGGPAPLEVELYGSPAGPDAATLLTALSGPATPGAGAAQWNALLPITLQAGQTYFVRLAVTAFGPDSYLLEQTSAPLSGPWAWVDGYTRSGGSSWNAGTGSTPLKLHIDAADVPEPSASAVLLALTAASSLRRRRSNTTPLG